MFSWDFPVGYDCHPDGYKIKIFSKGLINFPDVYEGDVVEIDPNTGGPLTSFSLNVPLDPRTHYQWSIRAFKDGVEGTEQSMDFWTEPVCNTNDLIAPGIVSPKEGDVTDNLHPPLIIIYPDLCIPENLVRELNFFPDFSGPNLVEDASFPTLAQIPHELQLCSTYYWRVKAVNQDGESPYSMTHSFNVQNLACFIIFIPFENLGCYLPENDELKEIMTLNKGEKYEVKGISEDRMYLYFDGCWAMMDGGEVEGDLSLLPVVLDPPQLVPLSPIMPSYSTNMFYYGSNTCGPQEIDFMMKVSDPDPHSVVLFYRLSDENNNKTEWQAKAMNPGVDDYFTYNLLSSSIPDHDMFNSAYLQVQIVGTHQGGEEFLRTEVLANQIMLSACGVVRPPVSTITPTAILPQCSDGIDNDGDGDTDMDDSRCRNPQDNNESG